MKWRFLRGSMLLAVAFSAWWTKPILPSHGVGVALARGGAAFLISIVLLLIVVGIQRFNPRVTTWSYPSWDCNPFDFSAPLQFFHLAAFVFFASALGSLVSSVWLGAGMLSNAALLFGVGGGTWLGVQLLYLGRPEGTKARL